MSINTGTVKKIARLARLKIHDDHLQQMAGELSSILQWIEQLNEVDITDVEPLANVNDLPLRWREDIVNDGFKTEDVLANAPAKTADFFVVPKVVE